MIALELLDDIGTNEVELQTLEIDLLLNAVYRLYGYDFRDYAATTVKRRLNALVESEGRSNISELIPGILHDEDLFLRLVQALSVTVTELFRDPFFYREFRALVLPTLSTYPFFKIWHAGCATGEEPYSMAIMLDEAQLLRRAQIHGTDMNQASLAKAREGIFELDTMREGQVNYVRSGGRAAFTDFYHARYNAALLSKRLSERMTFSHNNLVTDLRFEAVNLIVCRNVLIYFNSDLKNRVLEKFHESLCHRGFLCLGSKESLEFSSVRDKFEVISASQRIYRKL